MRTLGTEGFREVSGGLGALTAAMLTVAAIVWTNIDRIETASANVNEASEELAWADAVIDSANDQATAVDGLKSAHDPRYVEPYEEGRARFSHAFERLTAYAADDPPVQRRDVADAGRLAADWTRTVADPQVAAAGRRRPATATTDGRDQIEAIVRDVDDLRAGESALLRQRDRTLASAYAGSRSAVVAGVISALAFASLILGLTYRRLLCERRRAQETADNLSDALERARAAERAKTRFLANMSHEMRTPLNGVVGMVDALARTPLEAQQLGMVEAIRFSSATLDHLMGDLLSLSRDGEAKRQERTPTQFNLGAAARAIAAPFVAECAAKGLDLVVEAGADVDVEVWGDAGGLGQLIACLLSNAVKFTDQGRVGLKVEALTGDRFGFTVSDTGLGFDAATKSRLFEPFAQSDEGETRRHGGAGLGLALALRLAEELGGHLDAESEPGAGSRFVVDAPLSRPPAGSTQNEAAPEQAEQAEQAEQEAFRVLVVDDNAMNRKVLAAILEQAGVSWEEATDGSEAVAAARKEAFGAILMDIQMPVMDGLTATREIRAIERNLGRPATPIIVVSANCQPEYVAASAAAGAQKHLCKPVDVQALFAALNDVLAETPLAA